MEDQTTLKNLIAAFFETDASQISPEFLLSGPRLSSSSARYTLEAAIRRKLGRSAPEVHTARTYGELEKALVGSSSHQPLTPAAAPKPAAMPDTQQTQISAEARPTTVFPMHNGLKCGVDIETAEGMPQAEDYWTHSFYAENFTQKELAYCQMQHNPRLHFAARWCAKEAAKKCIADLLAEPMISIEVVRESSGAVHLIHHSPPGPRRLPLALSLSHSGNIAIAMVVGY